MAPQEAIRTRNGELLIPLTRGYTAIIDEVDAETILFGGSWSLAERREKNLTRRYAQGFVNREVVLMHKLILPPPKGLVVDHISGNGLDNRRSNLRLATVSQNSVNQIRAVGASGFRGVYRDGTKWEACSNVGKKVCIGRFETPEEAALKYDEWMREHFGDFARFNFPRLGERGVLEPVPDVETAA